MTHRLRVAVSTHLVKKANSVEFVPCVAPHDNLLRAQRKIIEQPCTMTNRRQRIGLNLGPDDTHTFMQPTYTQVLCTRDLNRFFELL